MPTTHACLLGTACLFVLLARPTQGEQPPPDDYGDPLPEGAVARLGTVRLRHVIRDYSGAACVALSPDGKTLVVSGEGNRAQLLEVATGKEVRQIEGPNKAPLLVQGYPRWREESLYWFAFSPDGKSLAGVSGKDSFSVWEVADG